MQIRADQVRPESHPRGGFNNFPVESALAVANVEEDTSLLRPGNFNNNFLQSNRQTQAYDHYFGSYFQFL